ncbi:cytochrome c oxidase subunit 7A precursor [Exophiala viscosa]|uniref:Cytochrome c oxidase subunit 9, mitochondrial n=1 Tax=Exophiala viscosa TaxID=2486360 RepID=A0AAN6DP39_9EURO|nr:cytochrome c oxidase subunit 7A precursor [Exophiala viscosa]KAI1624965.1 cytochrome c oxidase subunit 7A precursor [Exophiala viscosa]
MAIKPITGMLRRGLVLDLSIAMGLGTTFGYLWWYGYHLPRVRARDNFYARLEDQRAREAGFK